MSQTSYCLFLSPALWTFSVSNDLRACSSALFVMAERTPVVKKYRDALETVIGATMEFLARMPPSNSSSNQDSSLSSTPTTQAQNPVPKTPQNHGELTDSLSNFSPGFVGAAQESYLRGSSKVATPSNGLDDINKFNTGFENGESEVFGYMPEMQPSPASAGRWEGRHGEMGQMNAEWLLSLCEGDGSFSLSMLNEMMKFEPSLGA